MRIINSARFVDYKLVNHTSRSLLTRADCLLLFLALPIVLKRIPFAGSLGGSSKASFSARLCANDP